jgi:membrane protein required for colicin V production
MILDCILLILVILAFVRGWKKGLLWAICSLIAVFLGIVIALKLSGELAEYLFVQQIMTSKYTMLISFVILFLGTIFLFRLAIKLVEGILDKLFLGWINHVLGALLYSFFVVFMMSTFCWLSNQIHLLKPALKEESKTYSYIEPIAPKTIDFVSAYLPYCKDMIKKVEAHLANYK